MYSVHTMDITESVKELLALHVTQPCQSTEGAIKSPVTETISYSKGCLQTMSCGLQEITLHYSVTHCCTLRIYLDPTANIPAQSSLNVPLCH